MNTWLVLDANYLCYRILYTMGKDLVQGVVFGFLQDIVHLRDLHNTSRFVFCFDSKFSKRLEEYPNYKRTRRECLLDEECRRTREDMRDQIQELRRELLPRLGFQNVLCQKGYEADDLIASVCQRSLADDGAIIVSSDHDLLQLLAGNIRLWNPHKGKTTTLQSFWKQWGIEPAQWPHVKAIAGCYTDDIEGVKGIGEITAARWVVGKLKGGSKANEKILAGMDIFKRNLPLVKLPYEGTNSFVLREDDVTHKKWNDIAEDLGMRSLRGRWR